MKLVGIIGEFLAVKMCDEYITVPHLLVINEKGRTQRLFKDMSHKESRTLVEASLIKGEGFDQVYHVYDCVVRTSVMVMQEEFLKKNDIHDLLAMFNLLNKGIKQMCAEVGIEHVDWVT